MITGLDVDEVTAVNVLDAATWEQRRQRLQELGGPPDSELPSAKIDVAKVERQEIRQVVPAVEPKEKLEIRKFAGHAGLVHNVAVSADGKTAVSVGSDRTGIVWDVETGKLRHRLIGSPDQLYAVAITPDGKLAMTGGQDFVSPKGKNDLQVRAWDTQTGKQVQALAGHATTVSRLPRFLELSEEPS